MDGQATFGNGMGGSGQGSDNESEASSSPLPPAASRRSPLSRIQHEMTSPIDVSEPATQSVPFSTREGALLGGATASAGVGVGAVSSSSGRGARAGGQRRGGGAGGAVSGILMTDDMPVLSMTRTLSRSGEVRSGAGSRGGFEDGVAVRTGGFAKSLLT